jgi:hypothetical protein
MGDDKVTLGLVLAWVSASAGPDELRKVVRAAQDKLDDQEHGRLGGVRTRDLYKPVGE